MRDVVLCFGRRALLRTLCFASASCCASMTSCFASLVDVLRASKTRSAFRSRSGLLCVTPCFAPSREVATQRRWVNFLAFCWSLPLLPLPLSPLVEVLAFPCLFLFLSRRNQAGPNPAFKLLLFTRSWRWLAQQSIFSRRFAPYFASRAINSTPK